MVAVTVIESPSSTLISSVVILIMKFDPSLIAEASEATG